MWGMAGSPPTKLFRESLASSAADFVAVDSSSAMLNRYQGNYKRVVADGFRLPFPDKAFDYVLLNGVLHHLGYDRSKDPAEGVSEFLREVARVAKNEVIVYEIGVSPLLERLELLALKSIGQVPIFVLSERTLNRAIAKGGLAKREEQTKSLAELTSPFFWYLVFLKYPWFKLPAFLSPFHHSFFVLSSNNGVHQEQKI